MLGSQTSASNKSPEQLPFFQPARPSLLVDHIYRSVRERGHVQVTVGTTDDVGDNAKILAGDKAFALSLIELVVVVIDFVFQFGIAEGELSSAMVESEFEQVAAIEERPSGTDEEVARVLRAERAFHETDRCRSDSPLPAELRIVIMRAGQLEQSVLSLTGRIGDQHRWPAHLLKGGEKCGRIDRAEGKVPRQRQIPLKRSERSLDLFELPDTIERTHQLDPAAVRSGGDSIHLVKGVVPILGLPKETRQRIEREAEAVAAAV